jgi:F-type H+-transporting ATPase subunit alpha
MVTALGDPCDRGKPVECTDRLPIFRDSPPIVHRAPVNEFMPLGTKIVDIFMPVAKGQRQLILGDRMTGKTTIGLDAIIHQKGKDVVCVYCAVGKSLSALEKATSALHEHGALDHTVVVIATDAAPVGEQYLVPFSAASISDYFASKGKHVLVVFDDLTKHAWAYRQLSLLLERPPGREAYPGDIFYVQTQLMERAGRFNEAVGNGSVTFLGIAETQQGDLTGYIPSNLASMCDGQIVLSSSIFAEGFRPAIDLLLSMSIVGVRCQPPVFRELSRNLRADFARYNEVVKLSKLQSGLSGEAAVIVNKGQVITSLLQQGQYAPVSQVEEVLMLYAIHKGILMDQPDGKRAAYRKDMMAFAGEHNPALLKEIEQNLQLTPAISQGVDDLLAAFMATG